MRKLRVRKVKVVAHIWQVDYVTGLVLQAHRLQNTYTTRVHFLPLDYNSK